MNSKKMKILLNVSLALLGAISGFLYYNFIGCNGSCFIWSSPLISVLYGAILGVLVAGLFSPGVRKKAKEN